MMTVLCFLSDPSGLTMGLSRKNSSTLLLGNSGYRLPLKSQAMSNTGAKGPVKQPAACRWLPGIQAPPSSKALPYQSRLGLAQLLDVSMDSISHPTDSLFHPRVLWYLPQTFHLLWLAPCRAPGSECPLQAFPPGLAPLSSRVFFTCIPPSPKRETSSWPSLLASC